MPHVLVVSSSDLPAGALDDLVAADDTVRIVVPVIRQSLLDWLANDQKAFAEAEEVAERAADRAPGDVVAAKPGEADLSLAIRDALATFRADEIIVVVGDGDDDPAAIARKNGGMYSFDGVPVRWLAIARAP